MNPHLDFFDRVSVLIVGDVMLDRYLWGEIKRISPEAPVPVVEIERETHTLGGAANVANNLSALGVRCELFGVVGDDPHGAELQAMLAGRNLAFDPRLVRPGAGTITKTRIIAQRQQLCRLDKESSPDAYSLADGGLLDLLASKAALHDAVIISDYAKGVVCQRTIDTLRQVRAQRRNFLALDPKPQHTLSIGGFDLITPNFPEALQLAGLSAGSRLQHKPDEVAASILEKYQPAHLVITMGDKGMLLLSKNSPVRHFPSVVRQVADVTGAGDTVFSTLATAMAAGVSPEMAVHVANTAAGVVVGKFGTATVTRDELAQALETNPIGWGDAPAALNHRPQATGLKRTDVLP